MLWLLLMALQAARGDFQITTGAVGTVIQVRGTGFQGSAVLFWWNGRDGTADASGEASYRAGWGMATGPTARRAVAMSSLHAAADGEADNYGTAAACIAAVLPGTGDPSTLEGLADFDAWNADGFDIKIDDQFASVFRVHYLVIGGSEVYDTDLGTFTGPASPGPHSVTGLTFQPNCVFFLSFGNGSEDVVNQLGQMSFGVATGSGSLEQWVSAQRIDDAVATTFTEQLTTRGRCIANTDGSAELASLTGFTSDGYTLQFDSGGTNPIYYLALRVSYASVFGLATSTSNGATVSANGFGFAPKAALFVSGCSPDSGAESNPASLSIGAAVGSSQAAVALNDKNAAATSDVWTALDYDKVYVNSDQAATMAVEGLMAFTSWDGDGLTCTMTDGDPVSSLVVGVAFGEGAPSSEEDAAGLIFRGAQVEYTDASGVTDVGKLESAQAAYGDSADIAVLRVTGSTISKATISSVPHKSKGLVPPYWVAESGEHSAPPILSAPS